MKHALVASWFHSKVAVFVYSLDAGGADGAAEAGAQPATDERSHDVSQSSRPAAASSALCARPSNRPHHESAAGGCKY